MSIAELIISIANKAKGIKDNVLAAYDVIASKNGEVPSEKTMENLPAAISSMPSVDFKQLINMYIDANRISYERKFSGMYTNGVAIDLSGYKFLTSSLQYMFNGCITPYVNMENCDTSLVKNVNYMTMAATSLRMNLVGCDFSNVTNVARAFEASSYIGDYTLEDVQNKGIKVLNGLSVSIGLGRGVKKGVDYASILAISNGIKDMTGSNIRSITLENSKLTEEQVSEISYILSNKNWTLVI
jgi:hypothetical protein